MSAARQKAMTLEEFLAWDATQPGRWEFDGFGPVPRGGEIDDPEIIGMVGGTAAHGAIALNVAAELRSRLRGTPCRAFMESVRIEVAGRIRYPDVFVACGTIGDDALVAENPVVVFEVESPGTVHVDLSERSREYRATSSIQRYVVLAQDSMSATVFERRGEDWVGSLVSEVDAVLRMPEIGAELPLAPLYEGVFDV